MWIEPFTCPARLDSYHAKYYFHVSSVAIHTYTTPIFLFKTLLCCLKPFFYWTRKLTEKCDSSAQGSVCVCLCLCSVCAALRGMKQAHNTAAHFSPRTLKNIQWPMAVSQFKCCCTACLPHERSVALSRAGEMEYVPVSVASVCSAVF